MSTHRIQAPLLHADAAARRPSPLPLPAGESAWRRAGRAVWNHLEAFGRRRAEKELMLLGSRWDYKGSELARQLHSTAHQTAD